MDRCSNQNGPKNHDLGFRKKIRNMKKVEKKMAKKVIKKPRNLTCEAIQKLALEAVTNVERLNNINELIELLQDNRLNQSDGKTLEGQMNCKIIHSVISNLFFVFKNLSAKNELDSLKENEVIAWLRKNQKLFFYLLSEHFDFYDLRIQVSVGFDFAFEIYLFSGPFFAAT